MKKIIAVTNQKGGVGKTTTAVNLAAALGKLKNRVLLIDMDPQGNTTSGLGIDKRNLKCSSYDILIDVNKVNDSVIHTKFDNLSLIPSNISLAGAEIELVNEKDRESRLEQAISLMHGYYNYVIIDCPPSLGIVTTNALCICDSVIVPIQCEFFALEGLTQLINIVKRIKRTYNPKLDIEGVLLTMFDSRLKLNQQVADEVKSYFPDRVFKSSIPRTVKLSEAPSFGVPVIYYDRYNKGSRAYMSLAKEILKNNEKEVKDRHAYEKRRAR